MNLKQTLQNLTLQGKILGFRPYRGRFCVYHRSRDSSLEGYGLSCDLIYSPDNTPSPQELRGILQSRGHRLFLVEPIPRVCTIYQDSTGLEVPGWTLRWESSTSDTSKIIAQILLRDQRMIQDIRSKTQVHDCSMASTDITLQFLGGASEVGRSCALLSNNHGAIMIDCGLGFADPKPYIDRIDMGRLRAVFLTHAHYDHVGALPLLYKMGYTGLTYCTRPTLLRYHKVITQYLRVTPEPMYSPQDLNHTLKYFVMIPDEGVLDTPLPGFKVRAYPSAHMVGSIMIGFTFMVRSRQGSILFTGDYRGSSSNFYSVPMVHRTYTHVVSQGTYGVSGQRVSCQEQMDQLVGVIKETLDRRGKVLIATLQNRGVQTYTQILRGLARKRLMDYAPRIRVSPGLLKHFKLDLDSLQSFRPQVVDELRQVLCSAQSIDLQELDLSESMVVVASPGMLQGGSSLEILKRLSPGQDNTIVFTNFLAESTIGRAVLESPRSVRLKSPSGRFQVLSCRCHIHHLRSFSAHAHGPDIKRFINQVTPRGVVILNHGEKTRLMGLRKDLTHRQRACVVPKNLQTIRIA